MVKFAYRLTPMKNVRGVRFNIAEERKHVVENHHRSRHSERNEWMNEINVLEVVLASFMETE